MYSAFYELLISCVPSLAFSYIGSVTARHSSSWRQPNCGVQRGSPPIFGKPAITLGIGPHSSIFMAAYIADAGIIFLPCDFYLLSHFYPA